MIHRPCSGPQNERGRQIWADAYDKVAQARADRAAALQNVGKDHHTGGHMPEYQVTVTNLADGTAQTVTVDGGSFTDAALSAAETPFCVWDEQAYPEAAR